MAVTVASISKTLARLRLRVGCGGLGTVGGGGAALYPFSSSNRWSPSSAFCSTAAAAVSVPVFETPPSFSPQPQGKEKEKEREKERGSGWSRWLLFLPGAITFGLGTWQIFRRQEKIKMLDYRQKRLALEPKMFNALSPSSEQLDALEFRRMLCKGVLDEKRSIYVGPRSRSISGVTENGYYVITPLMPIPNDPESVASPILVNRGWVPRIWKDRSSEVSPNDEQHKEIATSSVQSPWWKFWSKKPKNFEVPSIIPVEVVGVVRGSENPSIFVPENDPASCQWFYVDVPAISRACGLPESTVYVEDINENVNLSCPYPVPKDVNALIRSSVMPQDHLNYTFTWYSLSAAVTFMAFKRLRPKRSQR